MRPLILESVGSNIGFRGHLEIRGMRENHAQQISLDRGPDARWRALSGLAAIASAPVGHADLFLMFFWRRRCRRGGRPRPAVSAARIVDFAREDAAIDTRRFARASDVHVARDGIGGGANGRQQSVDRPASPVQVGKPALSLEDLHLPVEDIHGCLDVCLERRGAMRVDERVWILTVWQGHHTNRDPLREQQVTCPKRGLLPSSIAVVEQEDVFRLTRDHRRLFFGERGAERCDHRLDPGEHEAHDIEVALDQQQSLVPTNRMASPVETVQQPALRERRRIR